MADLTAMLQAAAGVAGGIDPREHFNTLLRTGNGTSPRSITGVGFAPDFIWSKRRGTGAGSNFFYDQVRGVGRELLSNSTNAETLNSLNGYISSFDSDGFTVTAGTSSNNNFNASGETFVTWFWNAGGSNATNTDGTITSTVRANPTAGISIVSYTGTGTTSSVGHGLGTTPAMIICKSRTSTVGWPTWNQGMGGTDKVNTLNATGAVQTISGYWGSAIDSTVFGLISGAFDNNISGASYIAYCFAEVPGFSAFDSYTGNGSATGPSVTTDFEPTWLLIKRTDTTGDWILLDSARDATNPRTAYLEPNTPDAEATGNDVDFNSTGFQLKSTSASVNASGGTYIYACFA